MDYKFGCGGISAQAKLREVAYLEGHVMLKKLREALEYMRRRTDGQNKEDVKKAMSGSR